MNLTPVHFTFPLGAPVNEIEQEPELVKSLVPLSPPYFPFPEPVHSPSSPSGVSSRVKASLGAAVVLAGAGLGAGVLAWPPTIGVFRQSVIRSWHWWRM